MTDGAGVVREPVAELPGVRGHRQPLRFGPRSWVGDRPTLGPNSARRVLHFRLAIRGKARTVCAAGHPQSGRWRRIIEERPDDPPWGGPDHRNPGLGYVP